MGYAICYGTCCGCGATFAFNPLKVPSMVPPGRSEKEPICRACIERVNPIRIANGFEPCIPAPDAYAPIDEREL